MNIEEAIAENVRILKIASEELNAMGDALYLTACKYRRLEEADAELMDKILRFRVVGNTMYREMVDRMAVLDPDVKIRAAMSRSDAARDGCSISDPSTEEDQLTKWITTKPRVCSSCSMIKHCGDFDGDSTVCHCCAEKLAAFDPGHDCPCCGSWTYSDDDSPCDKCNE